MAVEHINLANTANMHGIVAHTVANAAAIATATATSGEVADKAVWLQTDTGELYVARSTTTGDFQRLSALQMLPLWTIQKNAGNATTRFIPAGNGNNADLTPSTVEAESQVLMGMPGVLVGILAYCDSTIVDTQAITARINKADTALTCTIAGAGNAASDLAHTAAFNAGDRVSVKYVQGSTAVAAAIGLAVVLLYRAA